MKKMSFLIALCAVLILLGTFTVSLTAERFFSSWQNVDISENQARQIALQDAGEKINNVTFTRSSLEQKSDQPVYHIDFYTDQTSYQYLIDGITGSISGRSSQKTRQTAGTKKEVGSKKTTSGKKSTVADPSKESESSVASDKEEDALKYIGVKKAQEIALKDAGYTSEQVTFEKSSLSHEDNHVVYDIHFTIDHAEYEYKVGAVDGTIFEAEKELETADSITDDYDDDNDQDDGDDDDDDDDHDDDDHDDDD